MAPRIELHPAGPGDRGEFIAAMRASVRLHRPWSYGATTPHQYDAMLERMRHGDFEVQLVRRLEDGALAGYFELSGITYGALRSAYLGYAAFEPHAGGGYMRDAMRPLLRHVFRTLKLHRIEANIQPGNGPSLALARGAGFIREGYSPRYLKIAGRWRDHERWALTVEDWRDAR